MTAQVIEDTIETKSSCSERNVLQLTNEEAHQFFMRGSSYCNFELPPYFKFDPLLNSISEYLKDKNIESCYKTESYIDQNQETKNRTLKPEKKEGVNYRLLSNKDGQYAWRPFQLINPALYVALVNKITADENWQFINTRFDEFSRENLVDCVSIPVISDSDKSDKAETISQWWHKLEQKSIELALDYDYLLHTDISDCYGSIYTHSIAWALHEKEVAKEKRGRNKLLGNYIDCIISDMSQGQTNGIPQGSTLMDFIAEIVLGYTDKLLTKKISELDNFKILRYRDDYRIFSNNPQTIEKITKCLSEVLSDFGLKLNTSKTYISNDVILSSLKPDKAYWFSNKRSPWSFQKRLFVLYELASRFPNSGTLVVELNKYLRRLEKVKSFKEDVYVIVSILVSLTVKNPKTYPVATAIFSRLISMLESNEEKTKLLDRVIVKYSKVPNTGLLDIWVQRITVNSGFDHDYKEPLTQVVKGNSLKIWELSWLNDALKKIIEDSTIVDSTLLAEADPIISSAEVEVFKIFES